MALRDNRHHNMLTHYIKTLFRYAGIKAWVSLGLMVFLGLTQGVGLLMLIPFLRLIGLGDGEDPGGLAAKIGRIFTELGLPLTMPSILCVYVGIVAAHAMVTRYGAVLNTQITYGFTQALRNNLYRALCRAEWLCFLRTRSSDVTHVLTSDLQRVGFAAQQLLQLIGTVVIAGVHIAVALIISVPMTLFARLLPRFSMIQQCVQRIANALPSFEATLDMEKRFEAMKEPRFTGTVNPLRLNREIRLSNTSFRYNKERDVWAVRDVDLVIPARGMTAIVGARPGPARAPWPI